MIAEKIKALITNGNPFFLGGETNEATGLAFSIGNATNWSRVFDSLSSRHKPFCMVSYKIPSLPSVLLESLIPQDVIEVADL
jgi:hypothetical protein